LHRQSALIILTSAFLSGAGCVGGQIELRPADSDSRVYAERFTRIFGREDQNQAGESLHVFPNHDIVMFADRSAPDGDFSQFVRLRTFWQYIPGLHHTRDGQINCTIDYILVGPRGALLYQGAGLLHAVPASGPGGPRIDCLLKSGTLALRGKTGDAEDVLGRCLISGSFTAREDLGEHSYYVRRFEGVSDSLRQAKP
jgi:hypothetical protein